ncbi:hypothetical protein [Paracidovorax oryzae]|uniref:hypothetical protein n=1 Tax=Paracidovorax oryzae TaxID=862720 RepID=UPI0035D0B82F
MPTKPFRPTLRGDISHPVEDSFRDLLKALVTKMKVRAEDRGAIFFNMRPLVLGINLDHEDPPPLSTMSVHQPVANLVPASPRREFTLELKMGNRHHLVIQDSAGGL